MGGVCGWVVCVDWLCVWMGGWVGRCVHGKGVNTVRGMAPSYRLSSTLLPYPFLTPGQWCKEYGTCCQGNKSHDAHSPSHLLWSQPGIAQAGCHSPLPQTPAPWLQGQGPGWTPPPPSLQCLPDGTPLLLLCVLWVCRCTCPISKCFVCSHAD